MVTLRMKFAVRRGFFNNFAVLFFALAAASCASNPQHDLSKITGSQPPVYDYPIKNKFAATIIGTPPEQKLDYSDLPSTEERKITIFPNRQIPEGFWYERGLKYSILLQNKPAPLVYVISGTGADHTAEKMHNIANVLYTAGFHVVLLPSPTHPNFIINASSNFTPGNPFQDAKDLYRLMSAIDKIITGEVAVTGRMVTGYSLGGMDSAFVAELDDREKKLNFSRVLLINPPYDLHHSTDLIDNYLTAALPNGINSADSFIKNLIIRLGSVSQSGDALDFSNERLLLDAYNKYKPSDDRLATTIGLSFRLSAANMIITSDIMAHTGYVFPRNMEFKTTTHLNEYMATAIRTGFKNYFNDIYAERFITENLALSRQDLRRQNSLDAIRGYLTNNPKIGLITNEDDIILEPGEVDKLSAIFGSNAIIFDTGGHVGNLAHPTVGYYIAKFLKGGQ